MNEQRIEAYANLIQQLLTHPNEAIEILQANHELLDKGLLQIMELSAQQLAETNDQNAQYAANFLRHLRSELADGLGISESPPLTNYSWQDYLNFLMEVLKATAESKGDPKIIYPLLQQNLDKLDDNLADILRNWATAKFSEVETDEAEYIANTIWYFSYCLNNFPLGNKANNMEIVIAGYETVLKVFTRESNPETWAKTQNNLAIAYSDRIRGERAENLENAIAAYHLALEVRTKEDFPMDWAMTQNNLANAYSNRIIGERAENLENAIAAYHLALEVLTKQDFPMDWAAIQNNLAAAYSNRIRGERAENLENAIAAYHLALEVRTKEDFPINWATTQNNLAAAYSDRIIGERAENLENAIATYHLALEVSTKEDFPIDWAMTQQNLGNAYRKRIRGDRAENLENAIAAYHLALEVSTKEDFPIDWAAIQNNLGLAYSDRIRGNQAENLENAIATYHLALEVSTKQDFPMNWAAIQNNLGLGYSDRIRGDQAENLENAIATYHLALEVYTKQDFPMNWAAIQNNLGLAYSDRIRGDQAENLENAIPVYHLALEVYTKQDFPMDWARTQNNLANAYFYRIRGDREENLENAIAVYHLALGVLTKQDFPMDWARTQNNLAAAYFYRIRGDREENLENAIAAFSLALQVRTLEADPIDYLQTTRNLGNLHFKEGNYRPAIAAYAKAITAVELSRSWSTDDDFRQEILEEAIDVYQNIIQCFVNLKEYDKAVEYAERSRSRMVAELMASKDLYPDAEIPPQLLEEYYRLQQRLSDLRRSTSVGTFHETSLPDGKSRFYRRDSEEEAKQNLAEIKEIEAERQQVWREIRKSDPILAGQLQVDPLSIEQMRALIKDEETAILSFYTTDDDTYIFIVARQNVQLFTCQGQGIKALRNWIGANWLIPYVDYRNQENQEWRKNMGAFLKELADRLKLNQVIAEHLKGIKELIIVPHLFLHQIPFAALPVDVSQTSGVIPSSSGVIPPTPLEKGGYEEIPPTPLEKGGYEEIPPTPLGKGGYEDLVSLGKGGYEEIPPTPLGKGGDSDSVLGKGGDSDSVSPFSRGTEGGSNRGTEGRSTNTRLSIPTDKQTTSQSAEKPKTPETKPTYLSDIFRLRIIPSCQILSYCDNHKKNNDSQKMGIVENATGDLIFTGYECQNLAQMFQVSKDLRLQYQQATVSNYRELTKKVQFLHSSHHASADLINPLESKLKLFDGEVTVRKKL